MKNLVFFSLLFLISINISCQSKVAINTEGLVQDPKFQKTINKYLNFTVPVISVKELNENYDNYLILDAREKDEFNTSHLPGAQFIGFNTQDLSSFQNIGDKPVVVYCSIGYRSEKTAEKLKNMGLEVYNLYGSIFEWVNEDLPLENPSGQSRYQVHGYNKSWSKWISNPKAKVIN